VHPDLTNIVPARAELTVDLRNPDAQEMAAIGPTAMIFVRGEYDGISHNPREYSTPEACTRGIDVLATTLVRLAGD
jgi:acetylornithine deacetylase/succinyl-diaminopimelate desuccinylase-like protein